jgi:hypothetical protein
MTSAARVIARVLAGRKRVEVATWKWERPQTITTLQRVPLPVQRVPLPPQRVEHIPMRFSDYVATIQRQDRRYR